MKKSTSITFVSQTLVGLLCIIAVALLFAAFIINLYYKAETNQFIVNCLIGVGTNVFGIIITVIFVQRHLDKTSDKKAQILEKEKIIRFNTIFERYNREYEVFVKALFIPVNERAERLNDPLPEKLTVHDFKDIYSETRLVNYGSDSAIEKYYFAEENLRNYVIRILEEINFEYHPELKNILVELLKVSMDYHSKSKVLELAANEEQLNRISFIIKNESNDWEADFDKGIYNNDVSTFVILLKQIKEERKLIDNYQKYISTIME